MANKQRFESEYEIPHDLKQKKLSLSQANKWQRYYVEGFNKKFISPRYYAWIKFRANFRLRKEGWIKSEGQWSVNDKNDFADTLWGIWHECKRKHFPTEKQWLDYFISELVNVRNGILQRDVDEEDTKEMKFEDIVGEKKEDVEPEETKEEEKETVESEQEEEFDLGEEEEAPPRKIVPRVVEDDGSQDEENARLINRAKQFKKRK
jgi:hypothetical protein